MLWAVTRRRVICSGDRGGKSGWGLLWVASEFMGPRFWGSNLEWLLLSRAVMNYFWRNQAFLPRTSDVWNAILDLCKSKNRTAAGFLQHETVQKNKALGEQWQMTGCSFGFQERELCEKVFLNKLCDYYIDMSMWLAIDSNQLKCC